MAIDPKLLEELESRRKKVILSGGQEKIDQRHAKGDWTARERVDCLYDAGSFTEIGMHTRHHCSNFGMLDKYIPGEGIVSGFGLVDGRPVAAVSADFMAQGGSLGLQICMQMWYNIATVKERTTDSRQPVECRRAVNRTEQ